MGKDGLNLGLVARPQLNDGPRSKGREHGGGEGQLGAGRPGLPRSGEHQIATRKLGVRRAVGAFCVGGVAGDEQVWRLVVRRLRLVSRGIGCRG